MNEIDAIAQRANKRVDELKAKLVDKDDTIKHLKEKAEFDMPIAMQGQFHNACTDPCDMIDGPCACGAWHSAKEWIEKLHKQIVQFHAEIKTLKGAK